MGVEFYRVSANFDMSTHGDLVVKEFINLDNAMREAAEQINEFMNCISDGGALDQEQTDWEPSHFELFKFYGVSASGEDFVTVKVEQAYFSDMEGSSENG